MIKIRFLRRLNRHQLKALLFLSFIFPFFQNCGFINTFQTMSLRESTLELAGSLSAPEISVPVVPEPNVNSKSVSIQILANVDSRATVKSLTCKLDNATEQECLSGIFSSSNLAEGDHALRINLEDDKGQKAQERVLLFRVDTVVPVLTVSQAPAANTGADSASIVFAATDATSGVAGIQCALDSAAMAACTSPVNLAGLSQGAHTFKIQPTDHAKNVGVVTTISWSVSSGVPAMAISGKPNAVTNSKSATFSFSGSVGATPLSSYECSADGAAYAVCVSPKVYGALSEGSHSFNVRGISSNGVVSSPLSVTWTVDSVAPSAPVINSDASALARLSTANMTFSASDSGSAIKEYQCSLDASAFSVCSSPRTLASLNDGAHLFQVKAIDNAGNESALGTFSWSIDSVVPTLAFSSVPASSTIETTANFVFAAADPGSGIRTLECSRDAGAYAACTSPVALSGLGIGTRNFAVKATDNAGNQTQINHSWVIKSAIDGAALYASNCSSCHGSLANSEKRNKSASTITSAISSVSAMSGNSAIRALSAAQIQAIATALGSKVVAKVTLASTNCVNISAPEANVETLEKLNRDELKRSLLSLLPWVEEDVSPLFALLPTNFVVEEELPWTSIVSEATSSLIKQNRLADLGGICLQQPSIDETCWRQFFAAFGQSVYGRPLTEQEVMGLTESSLAIPSSTEAIYTAFRSLFHSPEFVSKSTINASKELVACD